MSNFEPLFVVGKKGQGMSYHGHNYLQQKTLYVCIVGAERKSWSPAQEEKMQEYISRLITSLSGGELIVEGLVFKQVKDLTDKEKSIEGLEDANPKKWILWDTLTKQVKFDKLVIVSGHCPVGEEKIYCLDCKKFLTVEETREHLMFDGKYYQHSADRMVKVFTDGGVDTEVEIACAKHGVETQIHPAPAKQWGDKKVMHCEVVDDVLDVRNKKVKHKIKLAPSHYVKKKGYRSRNIDMAKIAHIVIDIEPEGKCKYCHGSGKTNAGSGYGPMDCEKCGGDGAYSGGTWTLEYAKKLGKQGYKVIIK